MPFKKLTCLASPENAGKKAAAMEEENMQIVRVYDKEEIPASERGNCSVTLHKKDGIGLGLTISGGSDKETRPKVSNMRSMGIAAMSDRLQIGDFIISVNGIRISKMKHAEIISLLKNVGETVIFEIEYRLPPASTQTSSITQKGTEIVLKKENHSFGLLIRGGHKEKGLQSHSYVVIHIRSGSVADKDGRIKTGDRIKGINGNDLSPASIEEVHDMINQSPEESTFTVEYDVSVMDAVENAYGPLLIEVSKTPGRDLGVVLVGSTIRSKRVICIEKIIPGSIADRCGALHIGDQVLSIDDVIMDLRTTSPVDAIRLLQSTSDHVRLQILPVCQLAIETAKPLNRIAPTITSAQSLSALNSFPHYHRSVASIRHGSTGISSSRRRFERSKYSASAMSLTTVDYVNGNQIVHSENMELCLLAADNNCPPGSTVASYFGIQLQGGVFATEVLTSPPPICYIENDSAAERCGRLQVGDRLIAVNGFSVENENLDDVNRMLAEAMEVGQVYLEIEFDVAESVVPSSGTFHVKLPKRRNTDLGIIMSITGKSYPNEPVIITEIRRGSVAHRTGTLQAGDRLLAIDGVRLNRGSTVDDALSLLFSAEDVVRLKVKKDEENSDDAESSGAISFTVELRKYGGPLGITISGTEESLDPIIISGLTPGGLADRTGAIHKGDQIISINNILLRAKPLSEAIRLLQTAGETVTLKIRKRFEQPSYHQMYGTNTKRQNMRTSQTNMTQQDIIEEAIAEHSDPEDDLSHVIKEGLIQNKPFPVDEEIVDVGRIVPAGAASVDNDIESLHISSSDSLPSCNQSSSDQIKYRSRKAPTVQRFNSGRRSINQLRAKFEPNKQDHCNTWSPRQSSRNTVDQHNIYNRPVAEWQNALKDLQSVGQSTDIMRELEESIMTTIEDNISEQIAEKHFNRSNMANLVDSTEEIHNNTEQREFIQLHKITLQKNTEKEDFGFSLSDGQLEKGIFVHSTRPDGPADRAGMRPYDRLLQINGVLSRDFDCCKAVPLIAQAGKRIVLVIARNPQNSGISLSPHHVPLLTAPVNVPGPSTMRLSAFQTM